MADKDYTVEGRRFFSENDYARAKRDKKIIDELRQETDFTDKRELERLKRDLQEGRYRFLTVLGRDFLEEVETLTRRAKGTETGRGRPENRRRTEKTREKNAGPGRRRDALKDSGRFRRQARAGGEKEAERGSPPAMDPALEGLVEEELKRRERRRKLTIAACGAVALCCLGYFGLYSYYAYRTEQNYRKLSMLRENSMAVADSTMPTPTPTPTDAPPLYSLDEAPPEREVLEEFKNLLIKNKKLIGWLKIDDTNIDYPVMQTTDNEYYLDHNIEQEYDKNGSIFMDKDCDVLKPSTNFILYGHHMVSGKMFGKLYLYQKKSYYEEHPYISFDTLYDRGTYQVMYVFYSKVYKETEIAFKYYQFIDANGAQEFDSYMQEMADIALYDTGVTAEYGDQLLTLSTCDNQSKDGRFVVVAKKIAKE